MKTRKLKTRKFALESLESRIALTTDAIPNVGHWHNPSWPVDVNADWKLTLQDAVVVINRLQSGTELTPSTANSTDYLVDVNNDNSVTLQDAVSVINALVSQLPQSADPLSVVAPIGDYVSSINNAELLGTQNLLTAGDVQTLLQRASLASPSEDAIIAVVDRSGRILGVRVESGVDADLVADSDRLAFAIDGAVAKARTAAFFSSNAAPLTSRTIRFISQSTVTQREVESSPTNTNLAFRGPGFVAPIGVGGHFPPEVNFTPQVDLFAIEHQSRDSQLLDAGPDNVAGTPDDIQLTRRFNTAQQNVAPPADRVAAAFAEVGADQFFETWPESYGFVTETAFDAHGRGIATLPGGIPLFKVVTDASGNVQMRANKTPVLPDINLVGGIGVFFPGPDGFATFEQGFVHASDRSGVPQSEFERNNAPLVLESEFIALVAAAGGGMVGPPSFVRDLTEFNAGLPSLPNFVLPTGRIDLVGITLEIYGPTPSRDFRQPGIDKLIHVGQQLEGPTVDSGFDVMVDASGAQYLPGNAVPEGWLIAPHDASDGSLNATDVEQIIRNGVMEAGQVRAAIRLEIDNNFRPGARTRMVLAVADKSGEVLGLFRMPDATIFSIDVAVAKARNTAYYADATALQSADRIDFNGDGVFGDIATSLDQVGDTVPAGTALTSRTFRFLVEPRYPTGINLLPSDDDGLVNDPALTLCDQRPESCLQVAPQGILRMPGINPLTAENLMNDMPLSFDVYAAATSSSFLAYDAFVPSTNFRDPGDATVRIAGTNTLFPQANQNGVVFFPGSSPLYNRSTLIGGFGVSGDGVDQDDVVTAAGFVGFEAPDALRIDQYVVGGVRLPFVKFNRNPLGA